MQQEKKSLSERFITKENKKKGAENVPPKKAEDSAPVKPEAPKQKAASKKEKPILSEAEIKKRKAKKTKVAVASFVLLLGVGVVGNWYYENTDLSKSVQPMLSASQTKTLGQAEYVGATTQPTTENEYFSSARLKRQNARDTSIEKLQAVIDKTDESEKARKEASSQIARLSNHITIENKIETLVTAKGVNNCLAVINEDGSRVDVIVDVEELSDNTILQIKEIAMQQLKCSFSDVSIIQSK